MSSGKFTGRSSGWGLSSLALAVAILAAAPALAGSEGFAPFAGSFRGAGVVVARDGHRERLTCRATGSVGGGGRAISQNIVCASDSYKFDIRGQMMADGSQVRGDWQETTRGVGGEVVGRILDNVFSGAVNATGFVANFLIHVSGRKMTFSLRPSDGDVARVDVSLTR
jgi:hypothetical protein